MVLLELKDHLDKREKEVNEEMQEHLEKLDTRDEKETWDQMEHQEKLYVHETHDKNY